MERYMMLAIVVAVGLGRDADARSFDACRATTEATFRACKADAQGEKLLALGKCANAADTPTRKSCNQQAAADARDAADECKDQREARQEVCERLGSSAYAPPIEPANYVAVINNPLFPLVPGTRLIYESPTEHNEVFVTRNTRVILGVTCVEVRDTVTVNGVLVEDTLDWFAQDVEGNVWYFGENSKDIEDGLVADTEGSWKTGVDGARPGIIMKAHPAVGDFYRQEFLLDDAEDLAEVVSLSQTVTVPAGTFANSLETRETTPLEPDASESKFYAPGVGNVLVVDLNSGERLELKQVTTE